MLLACLFSGACTGQDPILERAAELQNSGTQGASTQQSPAPPQARKTPTNADNVEPEPVQADDPPPGKPQPPEPAPARDSREQITLSGSISVQTWGGGPIRVDVFDGDQRASAGTGQRPSVVAQTNIERPGSFSLLVPKSAESVWIGAFADDNKNGRPDPADPTGWYSGNPLTPSDDQDAIELSLSVEAPPDAGQGLD